MRRTEVQNASFLKFLNCFFGNTLLNFMLRFVDQGKNVMAIRNFSQTAAKVRFANFVRIRGVCEAAMAESNLFDIELACIQGS